MRIYFKYWTGSQRHIAQSEYIMDTANQEKDVVRALFKISIVHRDRLVLLSTSHMKSVNEITGWLACEDIKPKNPFGFQASRQGAAFIVCRGTKSMTAGETHNVYLEVDHVDHSSL